MGDQVAHQHIHLRPQESRTTPSNAQVSRLLRFGSSGFKDDFLHGGVTRTGKWDKDRLHRGERREE
jgi:hypothetical protein